MHPDRAKIHPSLKPWLNPRFESSLVKLVFMSEGDDVVEVDVLERIYLDHKDALECLLFLGLLLFHCCGYYF